MARDWSEQPLGSLVEFVNGDRSKNYPSQADRVAVGVPFVNAGDLVDGYVNYNGAEKISGAAFDRLRSGKTRSGDILFCLRGTPGRTGRDRRGGVAIASSLVIIRPTQHVDRDFLYFMLSGPVFQTDCGTLNNGSAQPNVSVRSLSALSVCVPPVKEQRAIAGVLGALDDKIEQNRRTAQALEKLARAIFRAWFVDFEPVKAKAAGATSFPSMPQPVFDALPTRFVDSTIGPVPEGWEVKAIGDVVTVKGGATPSTKDAEFWEGGTHCWATPKDMSRLAHPVLLDTERRITDAGVERISSGMLPVGTVLMSSRAPVGYLAIAGVPTAINQGFIAMVCDGPLPPVFILNWAMSSMDTIKAHASGTTFPEISKSSFRPLPVISPDAQCVSAYQRIVDPLFGLLIASIKESGQLAEVRDYLLPRLLSGDVRVSHG